MITPKINIAKLIRIYNNADAQGRALLIDALGAEVFKSNVMERVTSLREACEDVGLDFDVEFSAERLKHETEDETAYREWKIIAEALNEGVEVDYRNHNQKKWTLYVQYDASGRGLAIYGVDCGHSLTLVGPRLVFLNEKHARYFFNQFPDTINKFFSPKSK